MSNNKSAADRYTQLSDIDHVRHRPDSYIGSASLIEDNIFIADIECDTPRIIKKKISFNPGLERIYEELLLNSYDQTVRENTGCNEISVDIDQANGVITVTNNGSGIPVVMKEELSCYVPEMIFGMLRTGSHDSPLERCSSYR